jgi:adenylosuccinate synthase
MRRQLLEAYVGLQWGDEGKGKLVDEAVHRAQQLADGRRTVVVRYQGGANAGHSVYVRKGDELVKFVTHAAPTGLTNNADIAIGPQVAFNPLAFADELEGARGLFRYDGRVLVSERAGVLMDYHKILDACWEKKAGGGVGTTKQGIGPFYVDNARRTTRITFADYVSEGFADTLGRVLRLKEPELRDAEPEFEAAGIRRAELLDMLVAKHDVVRRALRPFATNLEDSMYNHLTGGHHMIIEGGQGSGLDVDMGTIPDQTSSHLLAPHAFPSLGISRSPFNFC